MYENLKTHSKTASIQHQEIHDIISGSINEYIPNEGELELDK